MNVPQNHHDRRQHTVEIHSGPEGGLSSRVRTHAPEKHINIPIIIDKDTTGNRSHNTETWLAIRDVEDPSCLLMADDDVWIDRT